MNDMTKDAWIIISTGVANALVSAGLVISLFLWLRAELHADIADLRGDMVEMRTEVRTDMVEMRTEFRAELAAMRTDIDNIKERLIRLEVIVERAHPPLITTEPPPVPS